MTLATDIKIYKVNLAIVTNQLSSLMSL